MATLPQYRFGKVTGLTPDLTVVSERSESPMTCCGYCSAQMACITAAAGVSNFMVDEAHAMRACCGRKHNAGSKPSELRNGALKAVGVTLKSVKIADMPTRLQRGFAIVVSIQYGKLPGWIKVQQNDFGHSACLFGWLNGRVGYFDPLWSQNARGAWAPWPDIKAALWPDGDHSTTVTKRSTPVEDNMGGDFLIDMGAASTRKHGRIAPGTAFFNDWELKEKRGTIGPNGSDSPIYGQRANTYAVHLHTGQGQSDGKPLDFMCYVAKTSVSNIVVDPLPVGGDCDEQVVQAVMQRDSEWEDALKGGEPWPSET